MKIKKRRRPQTLAYSIPRLVKVTGLGRSTIYEAIGHGNLTARKCGRRTIVLRTDALKWLRALPTA
jgi:hypothetical protein